MAETSMKVLKRNTPGRLRQLRRALKQEALYYGKYATPHTEAAFNKRDKTAGDPCLGYISTCLTVRALEDAMRVLGVD